MLTKEITRRSALTLASASIAVLSARPGLAAPPIVSPELTPQQFGARGGDAVADTAGWNRAVEEAARSRRPLIARGTYVLRPPAASYWTLGNRPTAHAHVAVQLRSGVQIIGKDAEILCGRPERPPIAKEERHFLFGTGLNEAPGTLRDISFEGLTFDFRDEFGPLHGSTYAIGVIGVDGLQRRNLTFRSSSVQAGFCFMSENSRGRRDSDIRHLNIRQGLWARYDRDVSMKDIAFDTFREALDFEGPCWDVSLERLRFKNGSHEAQCIDTAGGARWMVSDIEAENVGPIVYVYVKGSAWPTYREWLHSKGADTPSYVAPEDMTFRNVRGVNAGQKKRNGEVLRIGSYRSKKWQKNHPQGGAIPRNITIENWTIEGGSQMAVNDCENLLMRNISLSRIWAPDDPKAGAALVLREAAVEFGGAVTGSVSNVKIKDSEGMGISVVAGRGLKLDDITVEGFDRAGGRDTNAGIRMAPREGTRERASLGRNSITGGRSNAKQLDLRDN